MVVTVAVPLASPRHAIPVVFVNARSGFAFTVTVYCAVVVQLPTVLVPVTVYTVVPVGITVVVLAVLVVLHA